MGNSGTQNNEAADLLAVVHQQQARTRRRLGMGWFVAVLGGVALLIAAGAQASGLEPWVKAVVTGGLCIVVGVVGSKIVKRSEKRFGFELELRGVLVAALLVGVAVGTAWIAIQNNDRPTNNAAMVGGMVGVIVCGLLLLAIAHRRSESTWLAWAIVIWGAVVVFADLVSPNSYATRDLIFAGALFTYAVVAWIRAGRVK